MALHHNVKTIQSPIKKIRTMHEGRYFTLFEQKICIPPVGVNDLWMYDMTTILKRLKSES